MVMKLLDYSFARPDPAQIKADGFSGVLRYFAPLSEGGKIITKDEVAALQAQGLAIGFIWESYANRALEGSSAGSQDGLEALRQANLLGVPSLVPICFAVDYDAPESDQPEIDAYFDGVANIIGLNRTGSYGGYWVIKRLFDNGKITFACQTYAWSGGNWDNRAQLRQTDNGQWNGQVDFDEDEQGLAGLWTLNNREDSMNQDDVNAMAQARGFAPSQAEVTKWTDPNQFPTFKDAMYDIVKQYPVENISTPKAIADEQQIKSLQDQLNEAQGNDKATIIDLQEKLDNSNSMVDNLKSQLSKVQGPSIIDRLAQYNKVWIALAGIAVGALTSWLGVNNPIVQGVVDVLSVVGVYVTPNKSL